MQIPGFNGAVPFSVGAEECTFWRWISVRLHGLGGFSKSKGKVESLSGLG